MGNKVKFEEHLRARLSGIWNIAGEGKGRKGEGWKKNQSPLWLEECQHHASPSMTGTFKEESNMLPLEYREHLRDVLPYLPYPITSYMT